MYNLQWKTMANPQPQLTTDRNAPVLLDEEDERERVLLVVVGGAPTKETSIEGIKGTGTLIEIKGTGTLIENVTTSYAMNVSLVREVIRARAVTRVPGTPAVMCGLVNVRGMVVTVLDLATALGSTRGAAPRTQMPGSIVLLEHSGRVVGLAVDSVRDVRPLDDVGLVEDGNAFRDDTAFVRGLASAGGELVTLLDVAALLSRHLISSGET